MSYPIEHSPECQKESNERLAARERWILEWPNYCKTCDGAGSSYSTYDPSPAGVSLGPGSMTDVSICPDCAEKGICSRCGHQAWNPDTDDCSTPCTNCGWDGEDRLPPQPECYCYMNSPNWSWEYEDLDDRDDKGMLDL